MSFDLVFLLGSSVKGAMLYPTLVDRTAYVPWSTSIPTMVIWYVFATCYYMMGMSWGALATYAGAIMWTLIVVQKGDSVSDYVNTGTIRRVTNDEIQNR